MIPRWGTLWCCQWALAGATPYRVGHPPRYYNHSSDLEPVASFTAIGSAGDGIFETRYSGNRMQQEQLHGVEENAVRAMYLSPDSRNLYTTGGIDGKVYIWGVAFVTHSEYPPSTTTTSTTTTDMPKKQTLRQEMARIKRQGVKGRKYPDNKPQRQDMIPIAHPERTTPPPPPLSIPLVATIDTGMRVNSMAMSNANILYLGGDDGGITAFNMSSLVNMTAADAMMRIVSGTVVKQIKLNPGEDQLCGVGSYGPPATQTDTDSQDAQKVGPETNAKVDAITSELPGGDKAASQDMSAAGALAELHSRSQGTPNGWFRCWNVAGLKKGAVPPRIVDVRKANQLNTLLIDQTGGTIYTGGDDRLVRQWTVMGTDPETISTNVNETNQYETKTTINTIVQMPSDRAMITVGTAGGKINIFNASKAFTGKPQEAQFTHDHGASVDAIAFYLNPNDPTNSAQTIVGGWRGMPDDPPVKPEIMDGNSIKNDLAPPGDNPGRINFYNLNLQTGTFELTHSLMKNGLSWVNVLLLSGDNIWLFSGGNDGSVTIWDPEKLRGKGSGEVAKDAPQATLKDMVWTANTPEPPDADFTGDMGVKMPVNAVKKDQDKGDQSGQDPSEDVEPAPSQTTPATAFLEMIKRAVRVAENEAASLRSGAAPPIDPPRAQHRGVLASQLSPPP